MSVGPEKITLIEDSLSTIEGSLQNLEEHVYSSPGISSQERSRLCNDIAKIIKSVERSRCILFSEEKPSMFDIDVHTPVQETATPKSHVSSSARYTNGGSRDVLQLHNAYEDLQEDSVTQTASSTPKREDNERWKEILRMVASQVSRDWRTLFRQLYRSNNLLMSENLIAEFSHRHHDSLMEQAYASLSYLYSNQPGFTVPYLIKGLRKCQLNMIADNIMHLQ